MSQRTQEIIIGLVVLVGLLLLGTLIVLFGEFRDLFRDTYSVTVHFRSAAGVRPGTPVFLTGVEVGAVKEVTFDPPGVSLRLDIDTQYRIPADSTVSIRRKGILADPFVEFSPGDPSRVLPTDGSARLEGTISPSIDQAAGKLQRLVERLDALLSDEELQEDFRTTLSNLARLSGRGTETLDQVRELTDELRRFVDLSSRLVTELDTLSTDLRRQVEHQGRNLDRLTDALVRNSEELNRSLETASDILTSLRRGEGSVGKLLTQDELYRQLVDTVAQTRRTVTELQKTIAYFREHPEVLVWGAESQKKESIDLWPF